MKKFKEKFSKEKFDEMDLTEMIYTAMDVYDDNDTKYNRYIWVSCDTLQAEKGSDDIKDLENLKNGFIVAIESKPEEDIWDSVVRAFVDYFNEKFDRDFQYDEWYEPFVEHNDGKVFTDEQLDSVFETCHNICLENRYEENPYYIVVDMDNYKAVEAVETIDMSAGNFEYIPIDPLEDHGLTDVYDNCSYALAEYFDTEFEMNMVYNFEIYED